MNHDDEKKIRNFLLKYEDYSKTKPYRLKILKGDQQTMNLIQAIIASILKDSKNDPIQQFQTLRFAKDCIETFNDDFISQAQSTILPHLEKIAMNSNQESQDERGKTYFNQKPTPEIAKLGKSFVRLALECVWVWSKWFPVDPDSLQISAYKVAVEKLAQSGVKFTKIEYFDIEKVFKYIPEQSVPIKILQECKNAVKSDLSTTRGHGSPSKLISSKLIGNIRTEILKEEEDEIFYSDKLKKVLQKHKKQNAGQKVSKPEEVDNELLGQNKQSFNANCSPKTAFTQSSGGNNNSIQESEVYKQMAREINKLMSEKIQLTNSVLQKDKEIKDLRQKLHISNKKIANLEIEVKDVDRSTSQIIGNHATPQVVYVSPASRSKYVSPSANNSPLQSRIGFTSANFQASSLGNCNKL